MPENVPPPHDYVPAGPLESQPQEGGYQPAEVRREAFAAVLDGIPLGAYDKRIIEWLVQLDDTTCRALASVMWRCRLTAPPEPGTATEWGVRWSVIPGDEISSACFSEAAARARLADIRAKRPWDGRLIRRTAARPAGPWEEVPDA